MQDDITQSRRGAPATGHDDRQVAHLRAFRAYWESLRKGHDLPRRSDIDPRRIEPLLHNAFVVERIAPGATRLRVAGTHLGDLMGMEVRGMPLSCLVAPDGRDDFALRLVELFDAPAALRLDLRSPGGLGRPEMTGTLILLPLRSDLGDVSRALGCLVTRGGIGRPSRRFGIVAARAEPLGRHQATGLRALGGGIAVLADGAAVRSRAHLRVVR
ncbi:PAS domain-containing protein [Roseovarius azorensis]|uniref:PAS domain-containing protein n=1 Tax=Roseovarius azorensis TaxID=1287727 RepID=A0A1H7VG14_9RHOB|nr:PAS domain-containing protein [Roseovarius azorensis]SEM08040.1 PAS domain-containing protein [Roseovarius azorensis]